MRKNTEPLFCAGKKGVFSVNTVEPIRDMDLVLDVADKIHNAKKEIIANVIAAPVA